MHFLCINFYYFGLLRGLQSEFFLLNDSQIISRSNGAAKGGTTAREVSKASSNRIGLDMRQSALSQVLRDSKVGGSSYKRKEGSSVSKGAGYSSVEPLFYPSSRAIGLLDNRTGQDSRIGLLPSYESGTSKYNGFGNVSKYHRHKLVYLDYSSLSNKFIAMQ